MSANKWTLFAKMSIIAGDSGLSSCVTKADFPIQTVYATLSGTKSAGFHQL